MKYFRRFARYAGIAPVALAVIVLSAFPASSATLTKERIAKEIIGKTLNARRMGMPVRIFYRKDGTLSMKFAFISGEGTWKYSGDGICMNIVKGPRQGETCVTFQHLGGDKYRNSEGIEFTVQN